MKSPYEVVLSDYGLASIPLSDSNIERFEVDIERLKLLPFFGALDRFMGEFFAHNGGTDPQLSYVIWGGVAANLLLVLTGRTKVHYSLHDVELFLVRDGRIYQHNGLSDVLKQNFSSNDNFLIEVGGQSIVKNKEGVTVEEFQKDRIYRNDGDLHLNNVILIVDCIKEKVFVEAITGTCHALLTGANALDMKDASDIRYAHRLARRIYRNISKAIRFEHVAGLTLSAAAKERLERLLGAYSTKLDEFFRGEVTAPEERELTEKWAANAKIVSVEGGKKWLYLTTLSETAKRLAGLHGLSSLDKFGFWRFLFGEERSTTTLFAYPLIELVRKCVTDSAWPSQTGDRSCIAESCYLDFSKYQRPGAEKLCEAYSFPGETVNRQNLNFPL